MKPLMVTEHLAVENIYFPKNLSFLVPFTTLPTEHEFSSAHQGCIYVLKNTIKHVAQMFST